MKLKFADDFIPRILASNGEATFEVMLIREGLWKKKTGSLPDYPNGLPIYSSAESLQAAIPMFEGKPAQSIQFSPSHLNHIPDEVKLQLGNKLLLENICGGYKNVRWGTDSEGNNGLIADLVITDANTAAKLKGAWNAGLRDLINLSLDGEARFKIFEHPVHGVVASTDFEKITTIDFVSEDAAYGKFLRLAASIDNKQKENKKMNAKQKAIIFRCFASLKKNDAIERLVASIDEANDKKITNEELEKIKLEKPEYAELIDKIKTAIEGGQDASVMLEELNTKVNTPPPPAPVITDPAVDPAIEKANALIADMEKRQEALVEKAGVAEIREQVTASVLPAVVKSSLIERLTASKTFDAEKIKAEISTQQKMLSDLGLETGNPILQSYNITASGGKNQDEDLRLALEGMFYCHNRPPLKNSRGELVAPFKTFKEAAHRLSGGKVSYDNDGSDAYKMIAGTYYGNLHKYDSSGYKNRLTASLTTSNLTEVFGDTMYRVALDAYNFSELQDWRKITKIKNLRSLYAEYFIRTGGSYGAMASVSEGGTFQPLTDFTDEQVSATATKYGGIVDITREMIMKDKLDIVSEIPNKLGRSWMEDIYREVFDTITTNAAIYDGTAFFASGHANYSTTGTDVFGLVGAATARKAMRTQTAYNDSRQTLGLSNLPKWWVVPPDLETTAIALTQAQALPQFAATAGGFTAGQFVATSPAPNVYQGTSYIVVDYWSDATDWAAFADPNLSPTICMGFLNGVETPDIEQELPGTGSDFTADKTRYKARGWRKSFVVDYRGAYYVHI